MQEKNNLIWKLSAWSGLVKYKLSFAVTLSAVTGYFLFRNTFGPAFFSFIAGIFLLVAGSAVLNHFMERERDAIMARTRERPLPSKKIAPGSALILLVIMLLSGSFLLLLNGFVPFALGCLGVILYNLLYTSLKKITVASIIPGALVGAIPPLIGYTSAGGTVLNNKILLFSVFMFLWQIPHFWLLLIRFGKEYQAAGFRTIYDFRSEKQIRYMVLFWVLLSVVCLYLFSRITGVPGDEFSLFPAILTIVFVILFFRFLFIRTDPGNLNIAFIIFNSFSILIMLLLISDSLLSGIGIISAQ